MPLTTGAFSYFIRHVFDNIWKQCNNLNGSVVDQDPHQIER
jgi:hypothetical protein